jgi:hypothetical protein
VLSLVAASPARAQAGGYGPFGPGEHYPARIKSCEGALDVQGGPLSPLASAGNIPPFEGRMEYSRPGLDTRLRITIDDQKFGAQVFVGDEARSPSMPLPGAVLPQDLGGDVICDDLNGDGVADFVAPISEHGNGLGAAFYNRFVVLSNGAGYRFWKLETMWPAKEDFVTFGRIEPIVMVTCDIVHTHGPERYFGHPPEHSYLVYDLWAFRGNHVVSVNSIDARFPAWVWFTYKANHLPATSVDAAEKQRFRPTPQIPVEVLPP